VRILLRILEPFLLNGSDTLRERLEVLGLLPILVQRDGLLAQPLDGEKMLDAAILAAFFLVSQMIFEEDALFANLPQIKTTVEYGKERLGVGESMV
jgi:hypothetical protein